MCVRCVILAMWCMRGSVCIVWGMAVRYVWGMVCVWGVLGGMC